jgi:hypothetical protein
MHKSGGTYIYICFKATVCSKTCAYSLRLVLTHSYHEAAKKNADPVHKRPLAAWLMNHHDWSERWA